jgi:hypothetical protein
MGSRIVLRRVAIDIDRDSGRQKKAQGLLDHGKGLLAVGGDSVVIMPLS